MSTGDQRADAPAPTRGPAHEGHDGHDGHEPIVAWERTARRMRLLLSLLAVVVTIVWVTAGVLGSGFSLRLLAELVGFGVLAAIAGEVVVVGGSALRGMLAAGARGDRLASPDVSLLPPQVTRRFRR